MFEFVMAEWHQPPDYIMTHWTDELFELMAEGLISRKQREMRAMNSKSTSPMQKKVSVTELANMTDMVKVVKK